MKVLSLLLAVSLPCGMLHAHDVWLRSEPSRAQPNQIVQVGLTIGERGKVEALWVDPQRVERLWVASSKGSRDVELVVPKQAIDLKIEASGRWTVAYISKPALSELASNKFDDYLSEEHLGDVLEQRRKAKSSDATGQEPVREHYSRSLKTLIGVGDSALIDCPLGLPLELSLVRADPSHLIVRASFKGQPLAGLWVDRGDARAESIEGHVTDAQGLVVFNRAPGEWVLRATHMQKSAEPNVDWRSWWATTTFLWSDAGIGVCIENR